MSRVISVCSRDWESGNTHNGAPRNNGALQSLADEHALELRSTSLIQNVGAQLRPHSNVARTLTLDGGQPRVCTTALFYVDQGQTTSKAKGEGRDNSEAKACDS